MHIAVLNGPNLNLLGSREPEVYGTETLDELEQRVRARAADLGVELEWHQTNHEGEFVELIQGAAGRVQGALINAAAFTHTSVAVRDAVLAVGVPFVEVHLSNIFGREPERRHSVLADLAVGVVVGVRAGRVLLRVGGFGHPSEDRVTPSVLAERRARVVRGVVELGFDGVIISAPINVRYLSGFTGSAGLLLLWDGEAELITDFRYREQSEHEVGREIRVEIHQRDPWALAADRAHRADLRLVGFEGQHVAADLAGRLRAKRRVRLRPVADPVATLRAIKDPEEVELIRKAGEMAEEALAEIVPVITPGRTELEVAAELERALRIRGSEWHPFETIVASGPRSALPHARTSERMLAAGDFVLIDFGATYRGYCSDLTRTFVLGEADERQRAMYELVRDAQRAALRGMRSGMTGAEVDGLARTLIDERGFGDAFGHSLGHGLGLDVHEEPRVSSANPDPLPEGCVVTVEPGVYFAGWGGVRIEDDVHLTADGAERLTVGSTEMIELK